MHDNGALDFRSVDIFSAADDHVFDAVTDEKIACVVEIARITRQQEAILGERLGAFFWPVPIANHRCRAPDADFTDLVRRELFAARSENRDLHPCERLPRGAAYIARKRVV